MKRFTKNMKYVAMMLSLCMIFAVSMISEAASAKYQPGVTYVNPATNSKNQYYSVKKLRMSTYSDTSIQVIYPKDGTISVSTNKKAMEAMITDRSNENITGETGKKAYVQPIYSQMNVYDYYNSEYLYYDSVSKRYYYEEYVYDYETYTGGYEKVYPDSFRCYIYTSADDDYASSYYVTYEAATKSYYFNYYDDDDNEVKKYLTVDLIDWEYYVDAATGSSHYLYKDNAGFYYLDYSTTVYTNSQTVTYDDGKTPDYEYAKATIQLTSTKAGTYKVNVVVNGKKTTLTVFVSTYGSDVYTNITLAGKTVYNAKISENSKNSTVNTTADYQVKKGLKTAKLKLKANKGMKITGIVTASLNDKGKAVYKKAKNGGSISLSQEYFTNSRNGVYGDSSRSSRKYTYVYVSYKDNNLKTSCTYSVVNKHGDKQIKRVIKATDGKKYTSYLDYSSGGASFSVWSY